MERINYAITKRRAFIIVIAMMVFLSAFFVRLFYVQIVNGEDYAQMVSGERELKLTVDAPRGEIYDRYMRPLNVNRTSFSVVFDYSFFPRGTANREKVNTMLISLTALLSSHSLTWNDTLPVTTTEPFVFLPESDKSVAALKTDLRLGDYATAEQCIAELTKTYGLEDCTPQQQRTVGGILYEMKLRGFNASSPFTFSGDISEQVRNIILEKNMEYPGVTIMPTPVREYVGGEIASHLLGNVGPIQAGQYEDLKNSGYRLNDLIGRSGLESALESVLRGKSGETVLKRTPAGAVVSSIVTIPATAGDTVITTLDSVLQLKAQEELDKTIQSLRAAGTPVKSGSVVMLDMTGGVLVCATWPNYNLATFSADYANLLNDPDKPMVNRALNGAFPCGSVMKPGVAFAALSEGVITPTTTPYYCNGLYNFFNPALKCMGHHRDANCAYAIQSSCNAYFYEVGRQLGIDKMSYYSTAFGLGQKTGIEVGESEGMLATPSNNKDRGLEWYPADTSQAAIGQSTNQFTPIQLATYAMTLANDGVRYKTHLVKSVRTYDGVETPYQPVVEADVGMSQIAIDTVKQGMIAVCGPNGTARTFASASYQAAGKTGTVQAGGNLNDHTSFMAYAPAENPEVAIAVFFEQGSRPSASGGAVSTIVARTMLDAYFASRQSGQAPTPEAQLLP